MSKGCNSCNSKRLIQVSAKCSDMFMLEFEEQEYQGYVPEKIGIGPEGDYIVFCYCADCGKIQSDDFPISEERIMEVAYAK